MLRGTPKPCLPDMVFPLCRCLLSSCCRHFETVPLLEHLCSVTFRSFPSLFAYSELRYWFSWALEGLSCWRLQLIYLMSVRSSCDASGWSLVFRFLVRGVESALIRICLAGIILLLIRNRNFMTKCITAPLFTLHFLVKRNNILVCHPQW